MLTVWECREGCVLPQRDSITALDLSLSVSPLHAGLFAGVTSAAASLFPSPSAKQCCLK